MVKKVGGLKPRSDLPLDVFEVEQAAKLIADKLLWRRKGEVEHQRQGIQIPGLVYDHLDSAAHHLALAACQHVGSPCTFCLAWADLEVLSLALEKRDDDVLGFGTSRLIRTATERLSRLAGDSLGSGVADRRPVSGSGRSSGSKAKPVGKKRTVRPKAPKTSIKGKSASRDTERPKTGSKGKGKSTGRTKSGSRVAGKGTTASTKATKRSKQARSGRKKKVSKRVEKDS